MSASKKKILSNEQQRFLDIAFHGTFSDEVSLQKDWTDDMYERLMKATRRCKTVLQEWLEDRKAEYVQELRKTADTSVAAAGDVCVIEATPRKVSQNGRSSRSPNPPEKSKSSVASTSKKRTFIHFEADDRASSEDEQEPAGANLDKSIVETHSSAASSISGSSSELENKKLPPNSRILNAPRPISTDAFAQTSLNETFTVPIVPPKLLGPPPKRLRHLILAIEPSQEYVLQFVQPFLVYDTL